MWPFGPDWGLWGGLFAGLFWTIFWVALIVIAVFLLRRELPNFQDRFGASPALRMLEERYAKGEITREEFLERRAVLMQPSRPPPSPQPTEETAPQDPGGADPTQPIPPRSSTEA